MTDLKENLKCDFDNSAEWRCSKAQEFPDDARNLKAAKLLDRLASTVDAVPELLLRQYEAVWCGEDPFTAGELHSQMLREVGFGAEPADATEFVRDFLEAVRGERHATRRRDAGQAPRLTKCLAT